MPETTGIKLNSNLFATKTWRSSARRLFINGYFLDDVCELAGPCEHSGSVGRLTHAALRKRKDVKPEKLAATVSTF